MGVVERGPLLGREQEWNISEAELEEMVEADVLSKEASRVQNGRERLGDGDDSGPSLQLWR